MRIGARYWRAVICILVALAAACGPEQPNVPPQGKPQTRIVFVTDWKAQAEHGGFYQALAEGLYAKHGLDVVIRQGGPAVNVPQILAGSAADFGIGSNAFIPLNLVREGVKFKAVMAVFQKDPQVLITHPRNDVKSIADMKGKPILIGDASTVTFWPWLKAKYGFSDTQIRKYTFNLAPFLVDKNAIQEGYLSSEPYLIEKTGGFAPQVFLLADNGYPGYANMVLVHDQWIQERPEIVQAFVDATILGWTRYLYGDPSAGNALIKQDNPEMTDDLIAQAIEKMKSYGMVGSAPFAGTYSIGEMTDVRWKEFFDVMSSQKVYPNDLQYQNAYTRRFVRGRSSDGEVILHELGSVTHPADGASAAGAQTSPAARQ
jgi:NitT/TauT family transport system substrate-binding protein